MKNSVPNPGRVRAYPLLVASFFALLCLLTYILFILVHPLDWQQPETLRFHYWTFQSGVHEGPLSDGFSVSDILKPLSNKARGGSYEVRYLGYFLDDVLPKLYQRIFPLTGPFLDEPFNIFLSLVTALLLFLSIREWFSSRPAALLAAAAWLVTSQSLLDARYPVRPNMAVVTAVSIYLLWEMGRLRSSPSSRAPVIRMTAALLIGIFCHEYTLFLIPALAVLVLFNRTAYRSSIWALVLSWSGVVLFYLIFFWWVYPFLMKRFLEEEPLLFQLKDMSLLSIFSPPVFLQRLREFTLRGLIELARLNLGLSPRMALWERCLSGGGIILFLALTLSRGIKTGYRPLLVALVFYLPISLILFPAVPAAVEMPVYYYAPIVALFTFALGAFLAGLSPGGSRWRWTGVCLSLGIVAAVNLHFSAGVMRDMPGDFGFNEEMRGYVRDTLKLDKFLRSETAPRPLYVAYPRPRRFDISTKWDLMLRVWHGESNRVFAMMLPVLYLKWFGDQLLLGSSEEFAVLTGTPETSYEKAALGLADMPRRGWYDLRLLREGALFPEDPLRWRSGQGKEAEGRTGKTVLGRYHRSLLPPGRWRMSLPIPSHIPPAAVVVLFTRGDLQAAGRDDVYYRTEPLPEKLFAITLKGKSGSVRLEHIYGWSYQPHVVSLSELGAGKRLTIGIEAEGEVEVIGPVVVPAAAVRFHPWSEQ